MLERASHTDTPTKEVRARVEISTELSDDHRVPPPAPALRSALARGGAAVHTVMSDRVCFTAHVLEIQRCGGHILNYCTMRDVQS